MPMLSIDEQINLQDIALLMHACIQPDVDITLLIQVPVKVVKCQ